MKKNNANNFYFFPKKYYEQLLKNKNIELYTVKKDNILCSAGIFMFGYNFAHYHLSANNYDMRKYNANYFLLDNIFELAKHKGKKFFLLGGGRTNDKNDSLLKFKLKFSSLTKPFYIAGKIYNMEIYKVKYLISILIQSCRCHY